MLAVLLAPHRVASLGSARLELGAFALIIVGAVAYAYAAWRELGARSLIAQSWLMLIPVAALVARYDGGLRSPAIWILAFVAATATRDFGVRSTAVAALSTAALGMFVHVRIGARFGAGEAIVVVALLTVIFLPRMRRGAGNAGATSGRVPLRIDRTAVRGTTPRRSGAIDPTHAEQHSARDGSDALVSFLRGVASHHAADDAIVWLWSGDGSVLEAAAWSSDDTPSEATLSEAQQSLLLWVAQERMTHCDVNGDPVRFAAAPVMVDGHAFGAISLSARAGISGDRDSLKQWLPTLATQAARLCELHDLRREHTRQRAQTRILIKAAREFQSLDSVERLGQALCESILSVTSARRATLVRWFGDEARGVVESVSNGHWIQRGSRVSGESRVAACCADGAPEVWQDGRRLGDDRAVYGFGEGKLTVGSLAIVPLERDRRVIGAIVLEGDEPDGALDADLRSVRLLAAMAVGSLQTFWHVAEVTATALTDKLTGLANRRGFDQQFARFIAESARFDGQWALIIADIDRFKQVNDVHGHEAGDAVLKAVAATLAAGVREVDVCARIGGEEIAILLPKQGASEAREVAERLRKSVAARPVMHKGREISVSASFGIACFPDSAPRGDALFAAADRALYQAKAEGRNCVRVAPVTPSSKTI